MPTLRSSLGFADYCRELLYSSGSDDVRLGVAGCGVAPLPAHRVLLSVLSPSLSRMLVDTEIDLVIFPEGSEEEIQTIVNYLYKGVKGLVSQELAEALGLDEREDVRKLDPELVDPDVKMEVLDDYDVEANLSEENLSDNSYSPPPKKKRKKRKKIKKEMKEEDDDFDDLEASAPASRLNGPYKAKNIAEAVEMAKLLQEQPHRFRFYNRLQYQGAKTRRPNESEDDYYERVRLYDRFPGLIFEDECTRFVVCVECGAVTKNIAPAHVCERTQASQKTVDFLKTKPVEIIRRMHYSNHLKKYFKQKAEKAECTVCKAVLPSIDDFKVHLKDIHNIEPLLYKANNQYGDFVCQDCGKRFTTMNLMKQHEVTKHGKIELAKFKCDKCNIYFVTKTWQETHIKMVHEDYRPHVCEECAKSFKVKRHLLSHKKTHTGEKSFQCRHCEKWFAKEWTRTQHERLHLGLKLYKCEVCDQRFSQKTSLDCHLRTHHCKSAPPSNIQDHQPSRESSRPPNHSESSDVFGSSGKSAMAGTSMSNEAMKALWMENVKHENQLRESMAPNLQHLSQLRDSHDLHQHLSQLRDSRDHSGMPPNQHLQ